MHPLLLLLPALLATPAPSPPPSDDVQEVARSRFGFRGVDVAASGERVAVAWAARGGVQVRVEQAPPQMLFEASGTIALGPAGDGFFAFAGLSAGGNGFWWEHGRRIDANGRPLEPQRRIRQVAGDVAKRLVWDAAGDDLLVLVGVFYSPVTLWRVPMAAGGAPVQQAFTQPPGLAVDRPVRVSPIAVGGGAKTAEVLWIDYESEGVLQWSRLVGDGAVRVLRARLPSVRRAWWRDEGWVALSVPEGGRPRLVRLTERDGKPVVERGGTLPIEAGCGLWHGDRLWWLDARGRGDARRIELRAFGFDGAARGATRVVDPAPGRPHARAAMPDTPGAGHRCLAVTPSGIVTAWRVQDGRETVLRRRRMPVEASPPPGDPSGP